MGILNNDLEKVTVWNRVEAILLNIFSSLKINVSDYCDIQTVDGNTNIVLNNGALMTIIEYEGVKTIIGYDVFYNHVEHLTSQLGVYLSKSGYQLGFVFRKDLAASSNLHQIAELKKRAAKDLQLDLAYIVDEEVETYSKFVYDETNYIVLISHPQILDKSEIELDIKNKTKLFKNYDVPAFADSQDILLLNSYLKPYHSTFVQATLNALSTIAFPVSCSVLDVQDALRAIKKSVSPETTSNTWMAQIPSSVNSKLYMRYKTNSIANDISNVFWQPLSQQLMRNRISGVDGLSADLYPVGAVVTENRVYAPLLVSSPPQGGDSTFKVLFNTLNNTSTKVADGDERAIPFCISIMLEGDGFSGGMLKKTLAKVLGVLNANNSQINNAYKSLSHYVDEGGVVAALSMSVMTWAENNEFGIEEIQIRRSKLWRVLESWGGAQVSEKGGDPILGYTTNLLGVSYKSHAPKHTAPLFDALYMMPLTRPASPYLNGVTLNKSIDGKLIRLESFSPLKQSWIKLYSGRSGSGKSLALNNDLLDMFFAGGTKRYPYLFMFDVGLSGKGVVDMLHDHSPPDRHHLAVYRRFKNNIENSINPLECAVGRNIPTADQIQQIASFLSTLVTPSEMLKNPEPNLLEFLNMVVEKTFIYRMDNKEKSSPKRYERNVNNELDQLLAKNDIDGFGRTYYELVDLCHGRKLYRARDLCHRLAMPILSDTIAVVAADNEIKANYGNTQTKLGGSIIQVFMRGVTEAQSMYPVFTTTTKFDIDTARVAVFDLQDVIDKNNPKKASLFYQLCRLFIVRKILLSKEDIKDFPPSYRAYYTQLVEDISEDKKVISYDEFHNTEGDVNILKPVFKDGREGRKWNLEVKLSSQKLEDFAEMVGLATDFLIADRASASTVNFLKQHLSLNENEIYALQNSISLNTSGLTYFSKCIFKEANYSSLLTLTIPPKKYWCLTSDPDERILREVLFELLEGDRVAARGLLAKKFPRGAKSFIIQRKNSLKESNQLGGERLSEAEESLSTSRIIAKELVNSLRRQ